MSDSHFGGELSYLPDPNPSLVRGLSAAILEAERRLQPGDPEMVARAMHTIAERKGLDLPPVYLLELDVALVAEIPADLFAIAFKELYLSFRWRRLPEVADWVDPVRESLKDRKADLARLVRLERGLAMKVRMAGRGQSFEALPAPLAVGKTAREVSRTVPSA